MANNKIINHKTHIVSKRKKIASKTTLKTHLATHKTHTAKKTTATSKMYSESDSEFVDDTQAVNDNIASDEDDYEEHHETTKTRNKQNPEFSKASWANIAEEEVTNEVSLEKEGMPDLNPPFKLVTQKKKTPPKDRACISIYKRSRDPNPKPFK